MAILKSETNLILAGKVIPAGETFECPASLGDSLLARGFASNLKEAIPLTPEGFNAPENTPGEEDKEPEVDPREGLNAPENTPGDDNNEPEVDPREAEIRADYEKLEKEELIETAKAIGLNASSRISKEKLIDALVKAELEGTE